MFPCNNCLILVTMYFQCALHCNSTASKWWIMKTPIIHLWKILLCSIWAFVSSWWTYIGRMFYTMDMYWKICQGHHKFSRFNVRKEILYLIFEIFHKVRALWCCKMQDSILWMLSNIKGVSESFTFPLFVWK